MNIRRISLTSAAFVMLFAGTCKVPAPTSDSTPPKLEWVVVNTATNASQTIVGTGTVNAKRGDFFRVTLKAIDPEGVHEITLGGSATWTCINGGLGQNKIADFATQKQTLNPNSDGTVLNQIFLIQDANLAFPCTAGFTYQGGNEQLLGSGENYFGGKTNGTLTFNVGP